jgi:hypothetical protein
MKNNLKDILIVLKFFVYYTSAFLVGICVFGFLTFFTLWLPAIIGNYAFASFGILVGYFAWILSSLIFWLITIYVGKKIIEMDPKRIK